MAAIVVVGGGVAGLTCAWRLHQQGHDVEVLERESRIGGRTSSEHHGAFVIDRAPHFIASGNRDLHRLLEVLGLEGRIRPLAHAGHAVLRAGRIEPAVGGFPLAMTRTRALSWRGKAGLARLPVELARHRRLLDPRRPELAAPLDGEDMTVGLRRLVGEEAFDQLVGPAFSATFRADPESLSGAFALLALRAVAEGFRLQSLEGGIGQLPDALGKTLEVRNGCEAFSVETRPGGARIRYRSAAGEGSVIADAVVVATAGSEVPSTCPGLTAPERRYFASVRSAPSITVTLLLDRSPDALPYYGVAFPRSARLDLYGLTLDHHKVGAAPPGAGLLSATLTADAVHRLADAPETEVVEQVLDSLARTPLGRLAPKEGLVQRMSALPRFHPGYLRELAGFLARRERSPRLVFAGDYLVGPTLEGCVTSGLRAADEVQRAVER